MYLLALNNLKRLIKILGVLTRSFLYVIYLDIYVTYGGTSKANSDF